MKKILKKGDKKKEKTKTKSLLAGIKNFSAMAKEKFLIGV